MGIEITKKSKETGVKQASMLNTLISLFGLNGYGSIVEQLSKKIVHFLFDKSTKLGTTFDTISY